MQVSSIGNGLTIIIGCDYLPHHDWMSFLCYRSISNTLPDAKVVVTCSRNRMNMDIYNWPRKCGIPITFHNSSLSANGIIEFVKKHPRVEKTENILLVSPELVFVRDFEEANFDMNTLKGDVCFSDLSNFTDSCKSENVTVCCDYKDGWGRFVTSKWINKTSVPLSTVDFVIAGMTVNENRIARIWKSASKLYPSLSRG